MRILDIVDMQYDFIRQQGTLAVPGADALLHPAQAFLDALPAGCFDMALIKLDSHFEETYPHNPESQAFPGLHCALGRKGWKLVLDLTRLAQHLPVRYMTKNVFDMWGQSPLPDAAQANITRPGRQACYRNLFHLTEHPRQIRPGTPRDQALTALGAQGTDCEVVMFGVASDYCVRDAMLGWLKRGVRLTVLSDMVQGIGGDPDRALSGSIEDVIRHADFAPYQHRLRLATSSEILAEPPARPAPRRRNRPHRRNNGPTC